MENITNYILSNIIAILALLLSIMSYIKESKRKKEDEETKILVDLFRKSEQNTEVLYNTKIVNGKEIIDPNSFNYIDGAEQLYYIVKISNQSKFDVFIENMELFVDDESLLKYYDNFEVEERISYKPMETRSTKWEIDNYYYELLKDKGKEAKVHVEITTTNHKKFKSKKTRNSHPTITINS